MDPRSLLNALRGDPRHYQIVALAGLLSAGVVWLGFDRSAAHIGATVLGAVGAQWLGTHLWRLPVFETRSALITGLGLGILLRTETPEAAAAIAATAILSKFVIRFRGRHLFNPGHFGLLVALALGAGWIPAGQWGRATWLGFLVVCLGGVVLRRAACSEMTWAFLATFAGAVALRAAWLGDPWTLVGHRLTDGSLLLFAFFMISDPRTSPSTRTGRIAFGAFVALGAVFVEFFLFRPNGPFWALAMGPVLVPLLDAWRPGTVYCWSRPAFRSGLPGRPPERTAGLLVQGESR